MFGEIHWGMSPILDGIRIFLALLLLAPMYVFLDALKPWRHEVEKHFDVPKEGMVCYVWMSGILLIVGLLAWLPSALGRAGIFEVTIIPGFIEGAVPTMPGAISGLALFLKVVLLFAYLKRVAFNKVMRRYAREMKRQKMLAKEGRPVEFDHSDDRDSDDDAAEDDEDADDSDVDATEENDDSETAEGRS